MPLSLAMSCIDAPAKPLARKARAAPATISPKRSFLASGPHDAGCVCPVFKTRFANGPRSREYLVDAGGLPNWRAAFRRVRRAPGERGPANGSAGLRDPSQFGNPTQVALHSLDVGG